MPDALGVVKVGNSAWLLRRLTPSRAMAAMVGAVWSSTMRKRKPSATNSTMLWGCGASACANAAEPTMACRIVVPSRSGRRMAKLRPKLETAVLTVADDDCVTILAHSPASTLSSRRTVFLDFGMSDHLHRLCIAAALCAAAIASPGLDSVASAQTHDQIIAQCKQALMPQLRACVVGKVGNPRAADGGELEKARQACGQAIVRPCVMSEESKVAARVGAPAAPTNNTAIALGDAAPVATTFVAARRSIADITAILDSEKPDAAKIAARQATADALPPSNVSTEKLAEFYFNRAAARALLARNKDALADGLQALGIAKNGVDRRFIARTRRIVAQEYRLLGDPKAAMDILEAQIREGNVPGRMGTIIQSLSQMAQILVSIGNVNQANSYASRAESMVQDARGSPNPNWRTSYSIFGHGWEASSDAVRGLIFEARGQYADAEAAYRRAEAFQRASVKDLPRYEPPVPPPEQLLHGADVYLLAIARNESKQSKLSEAEAD